MSNPTAFAQQFLCDHLQQGDTISVVRINHGRDDINPRFVYLSVTPERTIDDITWAIAGASTLKRYPDGGIAGDHYLILHDLCLKLWGNAHYLKWQRL